MSFSRWLSLKGEQFRVYAKAMEEAFGLDVDYAMPIKAVWLA